jgi:hypothetical protein
MANSVSRVFILLVCAAVAGVAAADGSMRCGSRIIEAGMTQSEVLQYCGAPTSKTVEELPVRSGNQVVGKTLKSHWTYASYSATRVLVFDQDKLVSIQ